MQALGPGPHSASQQYSRLGELALTPVTFWESGEASWVVQPLCSGQQV